MARLIDADKLKAEIRKSAEYHEDRRVGYFSAITHIDEQPTVDAVEVVRCRDCAVPHNKYTGCPKLNGLVTTPDFYCPFGQIKDGDGNG